MRQHPAVKAGQGGPWKRELPLNYAGLTTFLESVLEPLRDAEKVSQIPRRLPRAQLTTLEQPTYLGCSSCPGGSGNMLVIKRKGERFAVRVAGVCLRHDHVLLQTETQMDFWVLPGGRCEMGEQTSHTVRREMWEETGLEVTVGNLLWVMENFFTYEDRAFHEIAFYYQMTLPESVPSPQVQPEFTGVEGDKPLTFRWFPLTEVEGMRLFPAYFRHALRELPTSPVHVVHHDVDD